MPRLFSIEVSDLPLLVRAQDSFLRSYEQGKIENLDFLGSA